MFAIEKNIPHYKPRTTNKYPWREMKVGDSFFVPDSAISTNFHNLARSSGIKISARKVEQDGVAGYRVWRIA